MSLMSSVSRVRVPSPQPYGSLVQLVERQTVNLNVASSSLARPANLLGSLSQLAEETDSKSVQSQFESEVTYHMLYNNTEYSVLFFYEKNERSNWYEYILKFE